MRAICSFITSLMLVMTMSIPGIAIEPDNSGQVYDSQKPKSAKINRGIGDAQENRIVDSSGLLDVTVPAVLPIAMDSEGNITTSTEAMVTNNSDGVVRVKVEILAENDWQQVEEVEYTINEKKFKLDIELEEEVLDSGMSVMVNYAGWVCPQTEPIVESIASINFIVDWENLDESEEEMEETIEKDETKDETNVPPEIDTEEKKDEVINGEVDKDNTENTESKDETNTENTEVTEGESGESGLNESTGDSTDITGNSDEIPTESEQENNNKVDVQVNETKDLLEHQQKLDTDVSII